MDDDALQLAAWRAGDADAGHRLVKTYYRLIFRFFFARVDGDACEDLTQATFEVLCRRPEGFRGEGATLRGYIFGIARMKLIEHVRAKKRDGERFDPGEHSVVDPASLASVSSLLGDRQIEFLVSQALRELPLDDQIVLELKEHEQLTIRELARLFDAPEGTIAGRIFRARQRLREATGRLIADPGLRAGTERGLESCMRSILGKIEGHLGKGPDGGEP
jgi:RNA polymerase sigma factor (sigma-70 family)